MLCDLPRQPVRPLTVEDDAIMEGIRARWNYPLNHWYQQYDRDDVNIMTIMSLEQAEPFYRGPGCAAYRCTDWDYVHSGFVDDNDII